MNPDNQSAYWDRVAKQKTFTHPLDLELVRRYFTTDGFTLDYGCGYGRLVGQLLGLGYRSICGYDTSAALIRRGNLQHNLPIYAINGHTELPIPNESIDHVLLFAVLTCIPSNKVQTALINQLYTKLKPGGIIYISDYYLQENFTEAHKYECLHGDKDNYGVFTLPEGVIFRHHTKEWMVSLLNSFSILEEKPAQVKTMNGADATAFQLIARKPYS